MRIVQVIIICLACSLQAQERQISSTIKVVQEYTINNYICPDFITFYAGQEGEINFNFKQLFKKINSKLNRNNVTVYTFFDDQLNSKYTASDFDDLRYDISKIETRYICVLGLGDKSRAMNGMPEGRSISFEEAELYWIYDFYMILVDLQTDTVVLSRKLNVMSEHLFDRANNKLVKAIGKELEII